MGVAGIRYRTVPLGHYRVCKNGHIVEFVPWGMTAEQFRHSCGTWTWTDGNYCSGCGQRLPEGRHTSRKAERECRVMATEEKCCEHPKMRRYSMNFANDTQTDICEVCGKETEELYMPELGQAIFGNPWSGIDLDRMPHSYAVEQMISLLAYFATGEASYAGDISNDVFEMRSYYWGDDEVECAKPNFLHRASGLEVRWYKYIGRGMTVNRRVCPKCFLPIFAECMNSILHKEADNAQV